MLEIELILEILFQFRVELQDKLRQYLRADRMTHTQTHASELCSEEKLQCFAVSISPLYYCSRRYISPLMQSNV